MHYREKVINIINVFGMKQMVAARAMGIKYGTIRLKLLKSNKKNNFTKENYNFLVMYIKENAKKLKYEE